jgi:hypothetical protein
MILCWSIMMWYYIDPYGIYTLLIHMEMILYWSILMWYSIDPYGNDTLLIYTELILYWFVQEPYIKTKLLMIMFAFIQNVSEPLLRPLLLHRAVLGNGKCVHWISNIHLTKCESSITHCRRSCRGVSSRYLCVSSRAHSVNVITINPHAEWDVQSVTPIPCPCAR